MEVKVKNYQARKRKKEANCILQHIAVIICINNAVAALVMSYLKKQNHICYLKRMMMAQSLWMQMCLRSYQLLLSNKVKSKTRTLKNHILRSLRTLITDGNVEV